MCTVVMFVPGVVEATAAAIEKILPTSGKLPNAFRINIYVHIPSLCLCHTLCILIYHTASSLIQTT